MSHVFPPGHAGDRAHEAAAWAVRLSDDPMPAAQRAEFQAWLDADPGNRTALEEIVGAWRGVEHYAASAPLMTLREAALASARRGLRQQREHRWSARRWAGASLAAGLLVAVMGALVWAWMRPTLYETGVGERRVVALSDGSRMSMDAATVVKIRYTGKERRIWLERGRARFEVARNPLRPFSVTAANEVVVATGTAFSVELVRQQVRVVLYEGHVAVLDREDGNVRRTVAVGARKLPADQLLRPGKELVLPVAPQRSRTPVVAATIAPADPVRSLSWEAGQLVFEDEPLDLVVERMNRYATRPLAIGDAGAAGVRVSGVFTAGDTEALTQGLKVAFGVESRIERERIVLSAGRHLDSGD